MIKVRGEVNVTVCHSTKVCVRYVLSRSATRGAMHDHAWLVARVVPSGGYWVFYETFTLQQKVKVECS